MKYYSTNKQAPDASLEEAVVKGLAADKGLFMPYSIKPLPQDFYDSIDTLSFQEIAYRVADAFFGEDVPAETLKQIVYDTLNFDVPLVKVTEDIYSLELFHGPTLAFKDVGGRFIIPALSVRENYIKSFAIPHFLHFPFSAHQAVFEVQKFYAQGCTMQVQPDPIHESGQGFHCEHR